jgi:hypothetical protein
MQLRTEIVIAASPRAVWNVLTDFPSYPEWNPFIPMVRGDLRVGAQLDIVVAPPEGRELELRPTLLAADPEKELRWRGHFLFRGLFDGEHFFRLTELEPNSTRFSHGEDFSGILVKLASSALTKTARGFVYMNQALKKRVETGG